MGKATALFDYVEIDGHDISNLCSQVNPNFTDSQEDVSGFSATGRDETIPGNRAQSITLQVFDSYGDGEIWDILYPIYRDRVVVTFKTRPNQNSPVGTNNPSLEGNCRIYDWAPNRQRGQVAAFPVTISAADSNGFDYVES